LFKLSIISESPTETHLFKFWSADTKMLSAKAVSVVVLYDFKIDHVHSASALALPQTIKLVIVAPWGKFMGILR